MHPDDVNPRRKTRRPAGEVQIHFHGSDGRRGRVGTEEIAECPVCFGLVAHSSYASHLWVCVRTERTPEATEICGERERASMDWRRTS